MKELNFEQMAQIEGGEEAGTPCPGGYLSKMSLSQLLQLEYSLLGDEWVIKNNGKIVCD